MLGQKKKPKKVTIDAGFYNNKLTERLNKYIT